MEAKAGYWFPSATRILFSRNTGLRHMGSFQFFKSHYKQGDIGLYRNTLISKEENTPRIKQKKKNRQDRIKQTIKRRRNREEDKSFGFGVHDTP